MLRTAAAREREESASRRIEAEVPAHLQPDFRADLPKEHEETTPAKIVHHIGKGVFYNGKMREENAKMRPRAAQERASLPRSEGGSPEDD